MTIAYKNALLGQSINASGISDTIYIDNNNNVGIGISSPSGQLHVIGSGIFSGDLFVNDVPVSVSGHSHSSSNITDFNSSVSGLLPVINILGGNHINVSNISGIYTVNASGTSSNIPQTLVLRDSLGNFVANEPTFNIVQLNPSSGVIEQDIDLNPAEIAWNSDQGTLDYGLIGNGTNLIHHIGQEIFYRVHNGTSETLYTGMAVCAIGVNANGRRISVAPYVADGSIREIRFVGIVSANIPAEETGYVTHFGFVRKLDTRSTVSTNYSNAGESWQVGDILYVDPTTPGKLTKFEPKHSISVAIVTNVNANNGLIFVRATSYGHLDDNHDVAVSGATNGQFLQYNSSTDYWVPSSSGNFSTLLVNGTGVSISGHSHSSSDITNFNSSVSGLLPITDIVAGTNISISTSGTVFTISASGTSGGGSGLTEEEVDDRVASLLVSGSGISLNYDDNANTLTIATTGLQPSGDYSAVGHTHNTSDIFGGGESLSVLDDFIAARSLGGSLNDAIIADGGIDSFVINDFSTAVSGLLPVISNSGDNRVLTSTGSSLGITAENNLTFNGSLLSVTGSGIFSSNLLLNNQTANTVASFDANKNIVSLSTTTYPTLTELSYVKGVTSSIQTQLNDKASIKSAYYIGTLFN